MSEDLPARDGSEFESLLEHLKASRGFDFTGYKRATLTRRVHRRMAEVGVETVADYRDLLEVDAGEFTALFNTILINVTSFFRDTEAWDLLRGTLLPALLERRPTGPLRLWSAGCASGQEAYSAAIALAELMGVEAFRERVKVYATDVDEDALAHARTGSYTERELSGLSQDLQERYFTQIGTRWTFRSDLRRSVIFGRADLVHDAPISRVDLLLCRNTLMYFTADAQARIAERLRYSLAEGGLLVLGKAEMLLNHASLFAPVDLKHRVFSGVGPPRGAVRTTAVLPASTPPPPARGAAADLQGPALMVSSLAQLLLDAGGRVATSNHRADALFGTSSSDVGRPFQDLEVSYRPVELRSAVGRAHEERRAVWIRDVRWARPRADTQWFDVQVAPLHSASGQPVGTSVAFLDVTSSHQLRDELQETHRHLETAYEELQSTNEELETTNEELQSTVEELETTNEELHSTNEELETMNEELQSMNDELQVSNADLRERTGEVSTLVRYMEAAFTGLDLGVAVVDPELRVRVWNAEAADLWGVRPDEAAGEHLLSFDIGLPLQPVATAVRGVLAGEPREPLEVQAVNRRGRPVSVRVTVRPVASPDGQPAVGAVVLMDASASGSEREGAAAGADGARPTGDRA